MEVREVSIDEEDDTTQEKEIELPQRKGRYDTCVTFCADGGGCEACCGEAPEWSLMGNHDRLPRGQESQRSMLLRHLKEANLEHYYFQEN